MPQGPQDTNLLVPFELENIPGEYQEYYKCKRQNFFSSIERFRPLWNLFLMLDQIIYRELDDLSVSGTEAKHFPKILFKNAHAKIKIAAELLFTGCIQEARSILRDAVENTAYAHHMLKDPNNQMLWLEKLDNPEAEKAFKEAFEAYKKDNLFKGLDQLYEKYAQLSELGSHPTPMSLAHGISFYQTEEGSGIQFNYTGLKSTRAWEMEIFSRSMTFVEIEFVLFADFEDRLKLDNTLVSMRDEFEAFKQAIRKELIEKYRISPPPVTE